MLTRLAIKGFKNLVDVEIRFGPVTYIAGPNGAGKSNVFDAIELLSQLADKPFIEAANAVRGGSEPHHLFSVGGEDRIQFDCDVLIPRTGTDDFGQSAEAASTYLNYKLALRYEEQDGIPKIRLEREELSHITKNTKKQLGFPTDGGWRDSVMIISSRRTTFIETDAEGHVRLHADRMQDDDEDKRGAGSLSEFAAERLPRTVLSSAQNAEEHRTAVLLRHEMRSWRQLHLDPSQLRKADDFQSHQSIASDGAHVAATLYRLASRASDPDDVYAGVANRLAELVEGIDSVRVERDEGRRLFILLMRDRNGVELPAGSLSDGTLRFIALAVMETDPDATGIVCLEEPENGIHPQRVEAMLRLLDDMAVDPTEPVSADNPLRQVIVSTHSPLVVANAKADDVVFAAPVVHTFEGNRVFGLRLRGIEGTWREAVASCVTKGAVLAYLEPKPAVDDSDSGDRRPRVRDLVGRKRDISSIRTSLFAKED